MEEKKEEETQATGSPVIKKYIGYLKLKTDLEAQLKATKMHLDEMQGDVLRYFQDTGYDKVSTDGMTLYPSCLIWAKYQEGYSNEIAAQHLLENGFPEFAKPTTNLRGLTSLLRECNEEGIEVPEAIAKVVKPNEVWKVGFRSV